jgi:hypothetical protein
MSNIATSYTSSHLVEYKDAMKRAVKRTQYAARALEAADAVITKNIHGATSFASRQMNVVREV